MSEMRFIATFFILGDVTGMGNPSARYTISPLLGSLCLPFSGGGDSYTLNTELACTWESEQEICLFVCLFICLFVCLFG